MDAITIPAHFDGEHIRLDEPIELEPNTRLTVTILSNADQERRDWCESSVQNLADAYGDEPEYPLDTIKNANPDYEGK